MMPSESNECASNFASLSHPLPTSESALRNLIFHFFWSVSIAFDTCNDDCEKQEPEQGKRNETKTKQKNYNGNLLTDKNTTQTKSD